MPVTIRELEGGGYQVRTPNRVHAKRTSKKKAEAQRRIINAADKRKAMMLRNIAE